ncbi:MAG TPA: cytochrome o ubiquinol oxidase subunit I [Candidatus Saccharimonadales bacterium]|nr:cytochrome o ubiquinol oxidase subunit I [Candidatus Saccharimonadales bacterium]
MIGLFTDTAGWLGRLSWDAFPHEPITIGGALMMVLGGVAVLAAITYYKKWRWLWREWLTSLDPKRIGVMYLIVAAVMLLRGFADVLMLRAQQATSVGSSHGIISTDTFQQVFSAHGTIMIFFVAMGLMFGIINLVVPLMIGARDVAFPFLNAASFWLFTAGMVLVNVSLFFGEFSAAGWLAYPPLSELQYSPGTGVDYWIWSLQIAGAGSLLSGINFLVTIIKMRCKGMTLMRMPVFVWSVMICMVMVIFAFPILTATLSLLALDRTMGMHFFTSGGGGNVMMYVNLIWAWGHPEVYILVLPAFGIYSEIVATFSRKRLFGYTSMVWALAAIAFFSFVVWLHHFFTMGAGADVNAFFGIMTMIIGIPTGVKIFNWLFTMFRGRIKFASPMIWFMGFVFLFTIGGMTGVMLAVPAIDYQVHNSLFLVAHFHTMIISGVVYGFFAGITYWFPKIFGFTLHEGLGKAAAWCWIVGFTLAFGPLYILGLMGATRRLDHYAASTGWQPLFLIAGFGAMVIGLGIFMQLLQVGVSVWKRKQYVDTTGDPWNGRTLEWSLPSPVPFYNYAVLPEVTGRDPFWESKQRRSEKTKPHYEDIVLPKNSGVPVIIAAFAFGFGFAVIWHLWWLAALAMLGIVVSILLRTTNDETEYVLKADEVAVLDAKYTRKKGAAA